MYNQNKYYFKWLVAACFFLMPLSASAQNININTSSPFLYPEYSKKISMDFQNAPLVDVLKIFSRQTSLNLITSEDVAARTITVYLDNVPVELALEQILRANDLTYEIQPSSNIYIVKPLAQPDAGVITRVYPLKYATVSTSKLNTTLTFGEGGAGNPPGSSIIDALQTILTSDGRIVEDRRTNSLIITDIVNNFPNIERTISRLDVSVPQILIEVEMLEVAKETADKIGVKIGETPLTFSGGERDHAYPWNQNQLLNKGYIEQSDLAYRVGTINASGLTAILQFLRTRTDTKNLARPRIMTLNNEPAEIKISTNEAIGVITQTTSSENLATSSIEAERVETGVFLTVTPQANITTNEITIALMPKVSLARAGGTFGGTDFSDPEERVAKAILRVQSGETIIIGGLLREDVSETITKVPFLGDIPLFGQAFRHKSQSVSERELIIFITPHILPETQKHALPSIRPRNIVREQDSPMDRLKKIEQELSTLENQNI
ncbi:MAG: hypothetical protein KAJ18_03790 [Candidatus Omnitrophica bacterium]|nr:hypothetical protein [Candidatus Omnitrophota bacterium]